MDLTYPYEYLGEGADALSKLLKGGGFAEKLAKASHPAVIVGPGILNRSDRSTILQQVSSERQAYTTCKQDVASMMHCTLL